MKKNDYKLEHALHNEAVCDYLELNGAFSDWTVTTAFYAALQFVSHKIFPLEISSMEGIKITIADIEDYARFRSDRRVSKHNLLSDLVEKYCNEISPDYDWLLNMSMTARYSRYQQDKPIAGKARSLMKKIKRFCTR